MKADSTARILEKSSLQHDEAQAALASSFALTSMESPTAHLDEASLPLFGAAELDLCQQAQALADLLTNGLCLCPDERDHRALLIDHALLSRGAHPLQIAVIGHELARRAGLSSFVGVCEGRPWTVLADGSSMALVGPATVEGRPDAGAVQRRCPHQVAYAVLAEIQATAPPATARRAEQLLRAASSGGAGPR